MVKKDQIDYDVVIVGGGMVGGSLALALSRSELRVAVIEAKPFSEKQAEGAGKRAIALSWGSRCILQQLNLWGALIESAMPIEHIHVSDKGHFGKTRLSAKSQSVGALGYVVEAAQIEKIVSEELTTNHVENICPAKLIGYQRKHDGVELTTQVDDKEKRLRCRILVGADGGMSQVRSKGSFDLFEHAYGQHAITGLLRVESEAQDIAYERFTADGPIAMLPHFDNLYSLVWTMPSSLSEDVIKLSDEEFTARLQGKFGYWLGELKLVGNRQRFPLSLSHVKESASDRVVLIGNAAHQLHPVAGQGFNLGLRDAVALADVLMTSQEGVGEEGLLQKYNEQRKTDQALITGFTDNIVKLFSNDNAALSLLRNSGLLVLDKVPMFKKQFALQTMGLGTRLARLKVG
ncbi:MAG: 2-octaprenyl-3-methyl-6-methoxy-1,4-benzoquinol hydroxylase [Cycloclasticus sp. symbiont of Poecilosclerida sp. M]|nr:MAG: 2-octaprenyl-3-methyl-6-methoxy-1,4-benzoquinol hydroxylase [Cycloclasticus sp. symbiont of Poecilosclerida sp. M]